MHPWNKAAIEEERKLKWEYGLGKKKEIFIAASALKHFKDAAKRVVASRTKQSELEKQQLLEKLQRYGLVRAGAELDDILGLRMRDILERRIQSLVYRKGLARSMLQSRQFITHHHIWVGEKQITSPLTLLTLEEEANLRFKPTSALAKENHPERAIMVKENMPNAQNAEEVAIAMKAAETTAA